MELIHIIGLGVFAQTSYLVYRTLTPSKVTKDSILLDTSVLIDGRILPIARSGLVSAKLLVPTSVVRELQFMADKADHDKRERARFGLDMIEQLQALDGQTVEVINDGEIDPRGVDEQLIKLAQRWNAKLCTIDYNLNKSARVQGVRVVNINELAHALRITYLPGEKLDVKLVQQGQEGHQAIGYLDDGTMVVVDRAKEFIGQVIQVEATRVLQTAAGKMMFAKHDIKQPNRTVKTAPKARTNRPQAKATRSHSKRSSDSNLVELANK